MLSHSAAHNGAWVPPNLSPCLLRTRLDGSPTGFGAQQEGDRRGSSKRAERGRWVMAVSPVQDQLSALWALALRALWAQARGEHVGLFRP